MQLDISNALRLPGQSFGFSVTGNFEPFSVAGEEIRFVRPVEISGSYIFTGENFFLKGNIRADYLANCCRCLKEIPASMALTFSEEFARNADEEHPDRYLYRGEKLELEQMVGDLISLNTPMRHLCGENCRGLCPECGADRNVAGCNCPPPDLENES